MTEIDHNKVRGEIVYRRTYSRPLEEGNGSDVVMELWGGTITRVVEHQRWLWVRAKGGIPLNEREEEELVELEKLLYSRKSLTSGRTLWLGGTEVAKTREASQFNCSGTTVNTINDIVDMIWLLMQGCGTGGFPEVGVINGFSKTIDSIEVISSNLTKKRLGVDDNEESFVNGVWTIKIGDSAEAWAKSFGKLLAGKYHADKLIFDFSNIRPAGDRLKGYGWISSGDSSLSVALVAIANILNKRAGKLLTRIDILDVCNWLGTVLSSRRSAEIMFHRFGDPEWEEFAQAKKDCAIDNPQRYQSNNSLLFHDKPTKLEIRGLFEMMLEGGGSEPGFINAVSALERAPWFKLLNPCAEILLGDKSFCNLVETNLSAFNGDTDSLHRAIYIIGRANYRQTCVNLKDGILQDSWHELNEFLRLTGVGVTGIVGWEHVDNEEEWQQLRLMARGSVNSMADELGLPRSKAVTTIKPSGTLSKVMGCTEGIHKPLGKYIFNNIIFSVADPLVEKLRDAGYAIMDNPRDQESCIITFPVIWNDVVFSDVSVDRVRDITYYSFIDKIRQKLGFLPTTESYVEVMQLNTDSAIVQLERYKVVMENYVDHNCSNTISYSPDEVPEIVEWLYKNWDHYVGVSWLLRDDPTKTAADLGYDYLPQDVVTKDQWYRYTDRLSEFDYMGTDSMTELEDEGCATGACPIK